jgi:hypothetical protein
MPNGSLKGVHFVKTPGELDPWCANKESALTRITPVDYVQVTGVGDFTKLNVKAKDE